MSNSKSFEDPDFNAFLNESFEAFEVRLDEDSKEPITYRPSEILAKVDETAYRNALLAWKSRREVRLDDLASSLLKDGPNADRFEDICEQVSREGMIPFVGAGLSIPSGCPGWRDFLIQMAEELQLSRGDIEEMLQSGEFEQVATEIAEKGGKNRLTERICARFIKREFDSSGPIRLLPDIFPRSFVITTNFDNLLAQSFAQREKRFASTFLGRTEGRIVEAVSQGEHHLFKLHGDAEDATCRVLTKSEYDEAYGKDRYDYERQIPRVLKRIFLHYPLLFLGCSLTRDRTLNLFQEVAAEEGDSAKHFALLEEPLEFEDRRERERILTDCNIKPIWYPAGEHEYVEAFLFRLYQQVER